MDYQNDGRISVSVIPTFQSNSNNGNIIPQKAEIATQAGQTHLKNKNSDMRTDKPGLFRAIQIFGSEFVATYILLFVGCMGCVVSIQGGSIPHDQISFTFGFAILIAVQCCGHLSGSHLNPLVTQASAILGNIPLQLVPIYILGQLIGAISGYGTLMLVTPPHLMDTGYANKSIGLVKNPGVCSPTVNPQINAFQGLAVEFIASAVLTFVCCAVWDRKNADKHDSVSIRFGLVVAGLAMAAGPYSGCNMNPVRSFAPALFNGDWDNHWIYWIGPLSSSALVATVYKYLFNTPPPKEEELEGIPLK